MPSSSAARPPLKRKNFTPASRCTKSSVNAMPTPRCARKKKRTVERDMDGQDGLDGGDGQERTGDFPLSPSCLSCLSCPECQRSRLLISAQLTTFHHASR